MRNETGAGRRRSIIAGKGTSGNRKGRPKRAPSTAERLQPKRAGARCSRRRQASKLEPALKFSCVR